MKRLAKTLTIIVLAISTGSIAAFAQSGSTHIRFIEIEPFNHAKLQTDAQVIFLKSNRNYMYITGDSSYINSFSVNTEDSTLTFKHEENGNEDLLNIVVIEYTDLNNVEARGNGHFYFHSLDEDKLEITNTNAKLTLRGKTNNIEIYSSKGNNDISELTANKMFAYMGEEATLQKAKAE